MASEFLKRKVEEEKKRQSQAVTAAPSVQSGTSSFLQKKVAEEQERKKQMQNAPAAAKQPVNKPASDKASAGTDRQQTADKRPVTINRPSSINRYMSTDRRNTLHQAALEEAKAQETEQARQAEAKAQAKLDSAKRVQAQRSGLRERQAYNNRYSEDDREIGRYGAGNIDLYNRPQYRNEDGSISTVDSIGFNIDGQEVLLPSVWIKDGKPYHSYDDEEVLNHYRETGEYLGKFNTLEESNAYAEKLHRAQEYYYSEQHLQAQRSGLNHRTAGLRGPNDPEQAARNEAVRLAEDQALRDAYRETYGEDAPEKSVWNQIKLASAANLSGLTKAGQGLINTADFVVNLIPRTLEDTGLLENATDNPVSNFMRGQVEMGQRDAETWDREVAKYSAAQGTTAGKIARFQEQVMQNVPQSVIAVMEAIATGGASAAASLGAPVQGVLPMVQKAVTELGKKAGFWYSFASELGNNYQEALNQGADNDRATVAALTASLANAVIEVGGDTGEGGLETLLQKIGGGQGAMVSWLLSLPEEGLEEVLQGITTRATNAAMFKGDTPLYGQGGVFDKEAAKEEFGSGMAVAAVLGGAQIGANAIYNKVTADSVREQAMQQLFDTLLGEEKQSAAPTHPVTDTQESTAPDRATTQMRMNQVQESAAALGESGSRALTAAYDEGTAQDLSAEDAYAGFTAVYNAKLNGQSMTEQAQQAAAKLPEHMRMAAESAAENDSIRASQAKYFGENAGLDRKDAMTKRANLSTKTMRLLDAVGKAAGVQVRFAETVAGGRSNASYENGVVTIALDTESPVQAVFTHEIVHRIREVSPESYGQLAQFVTSNMHQMKLRFAQASYGARYEASGDLVTEEIVADAIGFVLSDSKMVNKLVQENRSLAQRIADGIHDFVAAINRVLEGQNVKLTSSQKFTFRELEGQLDEMGRLLGNALKTVEKTGSQAYNVSNETKFSRKESQYGREEAERNGYAAGEAGQDRGRAGQVRGTVQGVYQHRADGLLSARQTEVQPVIAWEPGAIIAPKKGTVALAVKEQVEEYGAPCFVVKNAEWDAYWAEDSDIPPAFSEGGQVYIRETVPERYRGMLAAHELTHVMKQLGYKPYLDFIEATPDHLNMRHSDTQLLLDATASHRGLDMLNLTDDDRLTLYDEFNSSIYGSIAGKHIDDVRDRLGHVFRDFDAYAAELTELHRQFKASRTGAKLSSEAMELSDANTRYSLREKAPPKKTGVAYKVFYAKDGQLYPPMVANPGGAGTPVGVWLDADIGAAAAPSKTGRAQVQAGGKGTNASKGSLAFRPGWHLGDIPQAKQFARKNPETGKKDLFPADFVWAECEYAMDHDYQEEAMSYGYTENGKFRHSYAGLPKLPVDGYYRYRTNPNPDTVPWVITGAMKVTRILTDEETDALCRAAGVEPMKRQGGPIDLSKYGLKAGDTTQYSLKDSEGRKLSEEQQAFFAHSKVRDAEGRLTPVYHGTPNGGFTEFKLPQHLSTLMAARGAGYYFTDKKNARQYMKPINKTGVATNKQLYEVYLNITNPLVIAHNSPVSITKEQFKEIVRRGNYEWFRTNGLPHQVRGDKTANKALPYEELLDKWADQVIGAAYYDEDILAEMVRAYTGETNDILIAMQEVLGYDGVRYTDKYGDIWVAWDNSQIKNVDNLKPTSSSDIRYSLKEDKVGVGYDQQSESVYPARYSLKSWNASYYAQQRDKAVKDMAAALKISEKKAKSYIDTVNGIAKVIADDRVRLDYEASPDRSSFVGNTEYGGSIDFSTICKKRRLFTGTFEAIQNALPNTALTADEILQIRSMMAEKGYEVSCGLCYVEGSRANMGMYTQQFLEQYAKTNPGYLPNMAEMNTSTGQERIRREHPEAYAAYEKFMNGLAQRKPKMYQMSTEYQGEILNKFKRKNAAVDEKNRNGGLRMQSFSDFEIIHLIDCMQVIMDMSQVGLAGQAYTKVPDFAWALGDTGLKINLSLIAKGVDKQGNLILDETEGMARKDAAALRNRYSDNVGTIIVVFNDAQLKAAMADDFIDYIIPFHRSQWNSQQYAAMGLPKDAKDYTPYQNESYIEPVYNQNGKKQRPSNYMPNTYWDFSKTGKENAEAYLRMCAENNRKPKFSHLLKRKADGSYQLQPDGSTDGYWKLLIDFKMYNNQGVGVPQMPVKPEFNMDECYRMLKEYTGGHSKFPVAQDIVDAFVADYKDKNPGKKYSKKGGKEIAADIQRMVEQYGQIEAGEKPFREATLPKKTAPGKNVSQTVRTVLEAEATPEIILPDIYELASEGHYSFESITDKQAIQAADAKITDRGWAGALAEWTKTVAAGKVSKENTATGWALYNHAANAGDTKAALEILDNMVLHQRSAAQALQATRILKNLTPEAQLYNVTRSVKNLQEELDKRYGEKHGFKVEINENLAERFLQAQTDKTREEVLTEIYRDIGRQMPSRFMDKWNAWRYLAMLGNPRTHVRNIVGNAGFAPVVAAKNVTATGIEAMVNFVSRGKTGRTKSIITGATAKDRALLGAAWTDYAKAEELILAGGKYDDLQRQRKEIEAGRVIFKTKPLEAARRFNSAAMDQEDSWFAKPHYAAAMAGYCKANGITPEQIAKDGAAVKKAREYAVKEAQKATYRDTNALSQVFSDIGGKWVRSENPAKKAVGHLVEGILPFRKTPANILARGLEYSPLGIIKGVSEAVRSVKSEAITPAQAIDSISAGLTGTGLLALGFWLASMGLVRGHGSDDEKERGFEELSGHQSYSMEIGNDSYTLDWLAPECLPFFVGVNLYDLNKGKEETNVSTVLNSMTTLTEPMLEMSCLQSLNDLIDSVGYASSNDLSGLVTIAASAATSYITQAFPTLLGQIERSSEAERMTSYTDKNNRYLTTDMQYTIGKVSAKLPGWDFSQIPYIDAWGRTESSGKVGTRVVNNMLNPSYTSTIVEGEMEEELLRLYMQTDESVFPSRAAKYFNVDGERKYLTAEEYVKYATLKGQTSYEVVSELLKSKAYKGMNDEKKARAVEDSYTLANQLAKSKISDYAPDSWVVKAMEAKKSYNIPYSTFVAVRAELSDLESLKDADGDTITNSLGLLKMEAIYNMKGLTDKQRQALFEYMGVGKNVIHYNPALVKQKLAVMRKKAQ